MTVRRDFLAFTAGAVAARTVLPIAARANETGAPVGAPHPDAELIAACERHPALLAVWNAELTAHPRDKAVQNGQSPAGRAYAASCDLIAAAKPSTVSGLLAKARAAQAESLLQDGSDAAMDFTSDASAWAWDVMLDLLRLAGS